jgi:rhodanese-related sulfurtransferase
MRQRLTFQWMPLLLLAVMTCRQGNNITDSGKDTGNSPNITIKTISAEEAKNLIDANGSNPDFQIIDVRTPDEYSRGHIAGSVNIDFRNSTFENQINQLNKMNTYLIYCASGNRSGQALALMQELQFVTVYNLDGGISAWTQAGYPVVTN